MTQYLKKDEKNLFFKQSKKRLSPLITIVLGFIALIVVGSLILLLPISQRENVTVLEALFTSASAISVTGLSIVDIFSVYSIFGQVIILILVQVGGLGFMTFAATVFIIMGKRLTLKDRIVLSETYSENKLQGLVKLTVQIIKFTFLAELIGAILLSFVFIPEYGLVTGIYYSVYHAIASFCNSGIDVTGGNLSLFSNNILLVLTSSMLIFIGGIGFVVVKEVVTLKRHKRLSFSTKIILYMSGIFIAGTALLFALIEWNNANTIGNLSFFQKVIHSVFTSVNIRTAGFNFYNTQLLEPATKVLLCFNMFVGASPGSVGGGIKTTTFFVIIASFICTLKGREDTELLSRRINTRIVRKSFAIMFYAIMSIIIFTFVLLLLQKGTGINTTDIFFETISAFSTTGLSFGITAKLSSVSQFVMIIIMLLGRLGSVMLGLFITKGGKNEGYIIKHTEEHIMIG